MVVTNFAVEFGALVVQSNIWDQNGDGGEGDIRVSGAVLSIDGQCLFFRARNISQGHKNGDASALGSSGCRILGEACVGVFFWTCELSMLIDLQVNLNIGDGAKLHLTDYFQLYDSTNMDSGDQDFGPSAPTLLDPTVFRGSGVSKMAVTAGKNGKTYIINANIWVTTETALVELTAFFKRSPPTRLYLVAWDFVHLKVIIYSTPVCFPTYVYKLGFDSHGTPLITQAAAII